MDVRTVSTQTHVRYTHLWILSKPLDGLVKGNLLACVLIINSIQYQFTPGFFNTDTFFNRSTSRFEHFRSRSRDDSPSAAAQAAIGHMVWTSWALVTTGVSVITTSVSFYKITTGVSIGEIVWFLWSQQVFPWSLYRCFRDHYTGVFNLATQRRLLETVSTLQLGDQEMSFFPLFWRSSSAFQYW